MVPRRAFWLCAASLLIACGCSKGRKKKRLRRNRDAAAVVVLGGERKARGIVAEREPNNDSAAAQPIGLGKTVRGVLEGSSDVDVFSFAPAEAGLLVARLPGIEKVDLMLTLQTPEGKRLAKSDRGPAEVSEGIVAYPLAAGRTYHLVVAEYLKKRLRKKGRSGPSPAYELTIGVRESLEAAFEVEPNEGLEQATELPIDVERAGYLGWAGDQDLWRVPVPAQSVAESTGDAAPRVDALHIWVSGVEGAALQLALLGESGEVLLERTGMKGGEVALRNWVPPAGMSSAFFRVSSKRSHPESSYSLRVEPAILDATTEHEPNDSATSASALPVEEDRLLQVRGELVGGDVDFFAIPQAPNARLLDLKLTPPADADVAVSLVAEGGKALAQSKSAPAGGVERLVGVGIPAESHTWVRVEVEAFKQPLQYKMSYTLVPGLPSPEDPLRPDLGPPNAE